MIRECVLKSAQLLTESNTLGNSEWDRPKQRWTKWASEKETERHEIKKVRNKKTTAWNFPFDFYLTYANLSLAWNFEYSNSVSNEEMKKKMNSQTKGKTPESKKIMQLSFLYRLALFLFLDKMH